MNCRTLYYPIEDDDICGFVYKFKDKKFVYLNSFIPLEKQIFAAAHELYHIWYSDIDKGELLNEEDRKEDTGVMLLQKRLSLCKRNNERTMEIKLDKIIDMSLELYEKKQITYEKLQYLLSLANMKPSDFNVYEENIELPSEEEILKILEEEE